MTSTETAALARSGRKLRILMVAPQPFFRPRGTPFSVLHRVRALTTLGHEVDLITYPFGEDVSMPGLRIIRSGRVPGIRDVKIGPSVAKLLLDWPVYLATRRALAKGGYDLLHSHEEAAMFCAPLARRHGLPHVYDMHSSLPQQLRNFGAFNFAPVRWLFSSLEEYVLRTCDGVITICQDLADVAVPHCRDKPHAMIENTGDDAKVFDADTTAVAAQLPRDGRIVLYTGTFEHYQGIDLLLDAFKLLLPQVPDARLVLVGGRPEQVEATRARAQALGIGEATTFVGQVHPSQIPGYVHAAEVIVSPRSSGTNTPLKIYGYLRSGKPIVATNLHTHTQTLTPEVSELVDPTPEGLAGGMRRVLQDPAHARALAAAALALSDAEYSEAAYMRKMADFFAEIIARAWPAQPHPASAGQAA